MNILLNIAQTYLPTWIKKAKLKELADCTAAAFNCPAPSFKHLALDDCLVTYAEFTREEAEKALRSEPELRQITQRLYQNAYQMGHKLRQCFRLTTLHEVMTMSRILYQGLRIDFQGTAQGEITISQCFFSQFYSRQVCQLISSLDQGLLAGLAGGGQLVFSQRMTEGRTCCHAHFAMKEEPE
jgi:hypothetical protein